MRTPTNASPWVDLHLHSTKSDGSYSPVELLKTALNENMGLIAITDHDTLEGGKEMEKVLQNTSHPEIKYLTGIEISVAFEGGALHILGYGIDNNHIGLNEKLNTLRDGRNHRNLAIVEKLNDLGVKITIEDVLEQFVDNESQGRPHIANALIKKKIVSDTKEAFDRFLGRNGKAYVKRDQCTAEEAITLIKEAGGVAFLAHPKTLNLNDSSFRKLLADLVAYGLHGIEVYTPQHTDEQIQYYKRIAEEMGLLISAGSDFHGVVKPQISLGRCYQNNKIGQEMISQELLLLSGS